jgi:hypothetical protein
MPLKATAYTAILTAWDTVNNSYKTGLTDITVRLLKDGVDGARHSAVAIAEISAANAPGRYSCVLDTTDMAADSVSVVGQSATEGIVILPCDLATDGGKFAAIDTLIDTVDANVDAILADTALLHSGDGVKTDTVEYPEGTPVVGAEVGAYLEADTTCVGAVLQTCITDEAGSYTFRLPAGTYNRRISHPDFDVMIEEMVVS